MIAVTWGSATVTGPRTNNQDALLAQPPVFVVADGMGGHAAGELASALVVQTFSSLCGRENVVAATVSGLIAAAGEVIVRSADEDASRIGMGTTMVGLIMVNDGGADYWLAANIGDSRLYRFSGGVLSQVTVDHSLVQELLDRGEIDADQARIHPERNIVTRVLGSRPPEAADYWLFAPEPGERFLLCSDGLCGELADDQIAAGLAGVADPGTAASSLVESAIAAGGRDNATAIVIDVLPVDGDRSEVDADTASSSVVPVLIEVPVAAVPVRPGGPPTPDPVPLICGVPGIGHGPA